MKLRPVLSLTEGSTRRARHNLRRGLKQELDLHGFERKHHSTALRTIEDASFEQRRDVTVPPT